MKTYLLPVALAALAVSAIAGAQTSPSSSSPPSGSTSEPPSSMQAPSSTSSYSSTDAKSMKECVAKQKAANAQISDADAKRACAKTETK